MLLKLTLTTAILSSPVALAQDSLPTTIEHITIKGDEAKDIVNILTDSGADVSADASALSVRRLLCINVGTDSGELFFECAFRPQGDQPSPTPNPPNTSSEMIGAVAYNGCMLYPAMMPLVCDSGFDARDLPVVADQSERLYTIMLQHVPVIPPFAPYILFGVENLDCKAPLGTKDYQCTMQAKKVTFPGGETVKF